MGWNLPPGVEAYMIPGNRPEDEAWDKMIDTFFQQTHFTEAEKRVIDTEELVTIATKAIEYGIRVAEEEQKMIEAERVFYEEMEHD